MKCRVCACTDLFACPGGCSWWCAEICSACVETAEISLGIDGEDLVDVVEHQVARKGDAFPFFVAILRAEQGDVRGGDGIPFGSVKA